MMLQEDCCNKN